MHEILKEVPKGPFPFELTIFIGRHQLVDDLLQLTAFQRIPQSILHVATLCLERRELGGHEEEFTSTIPMALLH